MPYNLLNFAPISWLFGSGTPVQVEEAPITHARPWRPTSPTDAAAAPIDRPVRARRRPFVRRTQPWAEFDRDHPSPIGRFPRIEHTPHQSIIVKLANELEVMTNKAEALAAEVKTKDALLAAMPKPREQNDIGTQINSPVGGKVAAEGRSPRESSPKTGSKRSLPSDAPGTTKPPKKLKLATKRSAALVKIDGKEKKTGRIINPEEVIEGPICNKFPETLKNTKSKGFRNSRNDCYRNAALQALLHVPAIYNLLGNVHRNCNKTLGNCVTCATQDMFQRYWNTETPGKKEPDFSLKEMHSAVLENIPKTPAAGSNAESIAEIRQGEQLDSVNYLQFLLEHLQNDYGGESEESVLEVFGMRSKSTWTCVDCEEYHETAEGPPSTILSISTVHKPDEGRTIADGIRDEFIDATGRPRCESDICEEIRIDDGPGEDDPLQTRYLKLTQTPEVLIVQQKRFYEDVTDSGDMIQLKDMEEVRCEEYLNLGQYTDDGSDVIYRLDAVIAHYGAEIQQGHYIAAVRSQDEYTLYEVLDDTTISPTDDRRLFYYPEDAEQTEFQPYVLIYSKIRSGVDADLSDSEM
ncbi:hypothetical protein BST61_g761 [Cercospora zeina]